MNIAPYFPFYVSDWLDSETVFSMSLEEEGAYIRILALMWRRGGSLPDNPQWICNGLRCKPAKWKKLRGSLISFGAIYEQDGSLFNAKLNENLRVFNEKSKKSAQSASSRWKKEKEKSNKNNDRGGADALRVQCQTETETETETETSREEKRARATAVTGDDMFAAYQRMVSVNAANGDAYWLERGMSEMQVRKKLLPHSPSNQADGSLLNQVLMFIEVEKNGAQTVDSGARPCSPRGGGAAEWYRGRGYTEEFIRELHSGGGDPPI